MSAHRILLVEANEDGSVGGSHQVLYDMVREFDRSRFEPIVLFYQDNRYSALLREAGIRVVAWDEIRAAQRVAHHSGGRFAKLREMNRAIWRRYSFLKTERIALVHMNNSPRIGRDDWLPAARVAGIPIVTSARGDAAPLPGRGLAARTHRWLMRRFDRVLCVSEYIAAAMRAQGIPPHKVCVVHDGVDRAKLASLGKRDAAELRAELGVPEGKVMVAAVGNIREWKGQHVVLQGVLAMSPAERERLCVVFVGAVREEDREYHASLLRTVADHGLQDIVRFAGSRTDVPDIMATADIMVHSSTLAEPGGTVVIESMTFGAPVVVANKGGHLDYLTEGTGLVYDVLRPAELSAHLERLSTEPETRRRISLAARQRAEEFSISRTARKMEAEYLKLL